MAKKVKQVPVIELKEASAVVVLEIAKALKIPEVCCWLNKKLKGIAWLRK